MGWRKSVLESFDSDKMHAGDYANKIAMFPD